MAAFVALVALDGSAIQVNPEQVCALLPVPASLLPVGVTDGTYVDLQGNADGGSGRVGVQGTVAATAAALTSGSAAAWGVLATGFVDALAGTLTPASGLFVGGSSVEDAPGELSVITVLPIPPGSYPVFTAVDPDTTIALDGPVAGFGFSFTVETGGVATTLGATVTLIGPLS